MDGSFEILTTSTTEIVHKVSLIIIYQSFYL